MYSLNSMIRLGFLTSPKETLKNCVCVYMSALKYSIVFQLNSCMALQVVSCLSKVSLEPVPLSGYGFSVLNERPIVVGSVDYGGPAHNAGVRVGKC